MSKKLVLLSLLFAGALSINAQYVQKSTNGLYGVVKSCDGNKVTWLVKPSYLIIDINPDSTYSVCNPDGRWGLVSEAGKLVLKCQYLSKSKALEEYELQKDPTIINYKTNQGSKGLKSSDFTLTRDYTPIIRDYVENKINAWQKKGEFEKTSDFQIRVNENTRKEMVAKTAKEVIDDCIRRIQNLNLRMELGEYDADNESFLVKTPIGNLVLAIPISKAEEFKRDWSKFTTDNTYDIINGKVVLVKSEFKRNGKHMATYNVNDRAQYESTDIKYNFDPINIPMQEDVAQFKPQITSKNIQVGKSDVDTGIPVLGNENPNILALIIANENYKNEVPVPFALNDGEMIKCYFNQTLGVPEKNITLLKDATKNEMFGKIKLIKEKAEVLGDDVTLLVYYAGHGVPDDEATNAFLVPVDGEPKIKETLYNLQRFYSDLKDIQTSSTLVFLDACFSGHIRGDGMLMAARGIARKQPMPEIEEGNLVVLTATQDNEIALPYEQQGHGLFTYFLLKKIKESKGEVTMGELTDYVQNEVTKYSVLENSKKQTPSVLVTPSLSDSWKSLRLR